jgi:hypothetical protein
MKNQTKLSNMNNIGILGRSMKKLVLANITLLTVKYVLQTVFVCTFKLIYLSVFGATLSILGWLLT